MFRNPLPGVPIPDNPFFEDLIADLDVEPARVARALREDGYAIVDFPDKDFETRATTIIDELTPLCDFESWREGSRDIRIAERWRKNANVRAIAANAAMIELLSRVYGRRAFPFQTLNFPVGSQQGEHSDHLHFNSVPERFMCGVWVALEDTDETNGPLFFYPGSHKWPGWSNEHIDVTWRGVNRSYPNEHAFCVLLREIASRQELQRKTFHAKRGQAIIWASNLVHGGVPQLDKNRTRWSQVTHYFFADCGYTKPLSNDVFARQVLSRNYVNIATGNREKSRIAAFTPLRARLKALARPWEYL